MYTIFQKSTDISHGLTKNRATVISKENRLYKKEPFTNTENIIAKYMTQKSLQLSYKGVGGWPKSTISKSILWQN